LFCKSNTLCTLHKGYPFFPYLITFCLSELRSSLLWCRSSVYTMDVNDWSDTWFANISLIPQVVLWLCSLCPLMYRSFNFNVLLLAYSLLRLCFPH
jgi:hypothetical protein